MAEELKAYMLGPGTGGLKAVSATQWLRWLEEREKDGNTPTGVYKAVAWVYRATRLRANALARISWELLGPSGEPMDEPPFQIDMFDLLWRTEAARCLFGAAFWLILNNGMMKTGLQYLHPITMSFIREKNTHALRGYEQVSFNKRWPLEEMVYMPLWNPEDDVTPGPAPAQVALVEAGLAKYANEFAAGFFRDGALPMVLLTTPHDRPLVKGAAERIKATFNQIFKIKRRPWQTGVLEAGMDVKQLTPPIKDLMVPELMQEVRQQIANAFELPVTWLEDADNRATGVNEDERFWTATMIPEAQRVAGMMNRQLWEPMGLKFRFKFGDLEAIQAQEARKAEATTRLMGVALDQEPLYGRERTIWVIDQYWDTMGLDMTKAPAAEEPEPVPDFTPQDADEDTDPTRAVELAELDLVKWRHKVKNRGRVCDFDSDWIPADLAYSIKMALDVAETEADRMAAFDPPFV